MSCGLAIAMLVTGCVVLFCIAHDAMLRRWAMEKKLFENDEKLNRLSLEVHIANMENSALRSQLKRLSPHV
jgi:hypothetical protein